MNDVDTRATEVREQLDRLESESGGAQIDGFGETLEAFSREVVEEGTFTPDVTVQAELALTLRERLSGTRTQNLESVLMIGMMLGAALERDVPMNSDLEEAWRQGEFTLPD